jgi:nitrile hydratase
MLGVPPAWYKSDAYRSRAVSEPRAVLAEFGVTIPQDQKIRVWDSTAEIRYLVLPMQPKASFGLDQAELVSWVNRNSMIGSGLPQAPTANVPAAR